MKSNDSKAIFAWAMYDWANSAFATTVMAAFFPIFFKRFWSLGRDPVVSTAKLGMVNSLAGIIVALSAPLLGAVACCSLSMSGWLKPVTFDLVSGADAAQASFLSVGIWWAFFSLPLLLTAREPINREQIPIVTAIRGGLTQLGNTFQQIRKLKTIFLFLAAYWLYIDGVNTIIIMALDYGLSIGFKSTDLILALLITQFIGFPSAIVFGYLSRKAGTKGAIYLAIAMYLLLPFWGFFMNNRIEFYLLAIIIGLVQGGIQALSRSFYSRMIPTDQAGEYFRFYNMVGKFKVQVIIMRSPCFLKESIR